MVPVGVPAVTEGLSRLGRASILEYYKLHFKEQLKSPGEQVSLSLCLSPFAFQDMKFGVGIMSAQRSGQDLHLCCLKRFR